MASQETAAGPAVDQDLGGLVDELRIVLFRLARRMRVESRFEEISDAQSAALIHLERIGPSTPSALASLEGVSAPSMNRTLNALEEAGRVRRSADPEDGRRVIVETTQAGSDAVKAMRNLRSAWLRAELEPLQAEERETIVRAVEIFQRMVGR